MTNRVSRFPAIIFIVGLVLCLVACLLTGILQTPTITQQDFHYWATYRLGGETKTVEGVYRCQFKYTGVGIDPTLRYYEGFYPEAPDAFAPDSHVLAKQGDQTLNIIFTFAEDYLMGDGYPGEDYSESVPEPYLAVFTEEGYEYSDPESLKQFDAELISWEIPQPIENTLAFSGFSILHTGSMLAMLSVGILVIIACLVFVKKDEGLTYTGLDKVSIVVNFLVGLVALPFCTMVIGLMPLYVAGDELYYQIDLCTPVIAAFAVAASIALRRKGFSKAGFFIQFVGPALFALMAIVESIL